MQPFVTGHRRTFIIHIFTATNKYIYKFVLSFCRKNRDIKVNLRKIKKWITVYILTECKIRKCWCNIFAGFANITWIFFVMLMTLKKICMYQIFYFKIHMELYLNLEWIDDLVKTAGSRWMQVSSDRSRWKSIGEAYVQQWTATGWYN